MDVCSRPTVGAAASALIMTQRDDKQSVIDTQREMFKGYFDQLVQAAQRGEQLHGNEHSFYVCVQTRRERLLTNVIRNQFYTRTTRPIPTFDLSLYHYDPKTEALHFVWCIPDPATVQYLLANAATLPQDHAALIGFCQSFTDGTLI